MNSPSHVNRPCRGDRQIQAWRTARFTSLTPDLTGLTSSIGADMRAVEPPSGSLVTLKTTCAGTPARSPSRARSARSHSPRAAPWGGISRNSIKILISTLPKYKTALSKQAWRYPNYNQEILRLRIQPRLLLWLRPKLSLSPNLLRQSRNHFNYKTMLKILRILKTRVT